MKLWFVRHGESEATVLGPLAPAGHDMPLSARGREEARVVANYFATQRVALSAVYASTFRRAVQTGEPTAAHFGLTLTTDARLCERDWGVMNASTWTEVADMLSGMSLDERYRFTPEGGESWASMETRALAALSEIQKVHTGDVAIFTHGGVLRGLLPVLAHVDKSEHERFTMATGAISCFDTERTAFALINHVPTGGSIEV